MSSTNKTTNYELTQFLATDVPSWLVDYNGDMSKIDTQMKVNATAAAAAQSKADGVDSKADTNAADIDTLEAALNTPSTGLVARVSDVEGDVDTIESLIGNGTPTTTEKTLIGAINELDSDLGTFDGKIDTVEDKIELLTNRKFILIGDSYLKGSTWHEGGTYTYDTTTWGDMFCAMLGITRADVPTLAIDGAGFSAHTIDKSWLTAFPSFASGIANPETYTDVIIAGGINDAYAATPADVKTAMGSLFSLIRATFTNAHIHVAYIGVNKIDLQSAVNSYAMRNTYATAPAQAGNDDVTYIPDCEFILQERSFIQGDGVHPNATGNTFIANALINGLLGNSIEVPCVSYDYTLSFLNATGTMALKACYNGEFAQLMSRYSHYITLTTPVTCTLNGETAVELVQLPTSGSFIYGSAYLDGSNYINETVPAMFYVENEGTTLAYNGMAELSVVEGKLVCKPVVISTSDGMYIAGNIKQIYIPKFTITLNTMLS